MCTQLLMAVCDASSPPCCHAGVDRTALREIKLLQELSHPNIIGVSTLRVCMCGWVGVGMVGGSHDHIILIVYVCSCMAHVHIQKCQCSFWLYHFHFLIEFRIIN